MTIRDIVVTCRESPVLPRYSLISFNVAIGLTAASLVSFRLVLSSILEGRPVLGDVTVV